MDPSSNIYFYIYPELPIHHNKGKLCVYPHLFSEHASDSNLCGISYCMEKTKNNDGQSNSHSKREKISKNAVHALLLQLLF